MAIKNKFIHFKTRAAFDVNVPNPTSTADDGNQFYNYTTFIQDTKEIYTHGTFYKCNISEEEVEALIASKGYITEDDIPVLSGGAAATSGQYVSGVTVSGHTVTVTKAALPSGDVMASGNLATDYIIVGAGTKSVKNSGQTLSNLALKSEIPSLSGYATQSWVTSHGYLTSVPAQSWSSITDKPTTLAGYGITDAINNFYVNDETGGNYLVNANDNNLNIVGGNDCISVGITDRNVGIYHNMEDGYLHVPATGTTNNGKVLMAGSTAGSIRWESIDIPEIPVALPNPYALTINGTSYTGSSAVAIDTARILSVSTLNSSTVSAGYSYNNTSSRTISSLRGFSSSNPDSVIISTAKLTFTAYNAIKMDGLANLSGTYYIYCLSYMANGKIAVNGAVYA